VTAAKGRARPRKVTQDRERAQRAREANDMTDEDVSVRVVIVGGGVAGVSCAEELINCLCSRSAKILKGAGRYHITLVSSDGRALKRSEANEPESERNAVDVTVSLSQSDEVVRWLEEKAAAGSTAQVSLEFVQGTVMGINAITRTVYVADAEGGTLPVSYTKLCLCMGSSPKRVLECVDVVTVRDTDSVAAVAGMLAGARQRAIGGNPKVMVVGNGGIALDMVAGMRGVDVCWVVKHGGIGDAFFDGECGVFLEEELHGIRKDRRHADKKPRDAQRGILAPRSSTKQPVMGGASVGPSWTGGLGRDAAHVDTAYGDLVVEKNCEVTRIEKRGDVYRVELSNGGVVEDVSLIVSAIGVDPSPNVTWLPPEIERAQDGGIAVDIDMQTSCDGVFAAGDVCTVVRDTEMAPGTHTTWFQMRLWSQARSMGIRAAHCILEVQDQMASDLAFDLFSHTTTFLGKRVVLLGSFNGQGLETACHGGDDITFFSRVSGDVPGDRSFVRVVIQHGKVKGAICIGKTDLSEVLENLILDGLDVSAFGADIISENVDLDDIFD
jgi:NADPH-dependent 2,4-dienoyl-CoA reductase/sulfur reductase-like enzyme